jgi:hypothetical protein
MSGVSIKKMNRKITGNAGISVFALGCMFPLIAGPLLSTTLQRDVSWVIIPGTFALWAISLVVGVLSRQTEMGRRAARWSAYAIAIGLATFLFMEIRKKMDERSNGNNALNRTSESRATRLPESG